MAQAEEALALWRAVGDRYWEAFTLRLLGFTSRSQGRYEKAIEYMELALAAARALKE